MNIVLATIATIAISLMSVLNGYDYEGDHRYNHAEFAGATNLIGQGLDGSGVNTCYVDSDHRHGRHPFFCNEDGCKYTHDGRNETTHGINVMSIAVGYPHTTPDGIFATGVAPGAAIVATNGGECHIENVAQQMGSYQWEIYHDDVWGVGSSCNDGSKALFGCNSQPNKITVGIANWDTEKNIPLFALSTSHNTSHPILKPDIVALGNEQCGAGAGHTVYSCWYGSSQSSPHITGALAIYKEAFPERSFAQAKSALMLTADPVWHKPEDRLALPSEVGSGYINVADAVGLGFLLSSIHPSEYRTYSPLSGQNPSRINYPSIKDDCLVGETCTYTRTFENLTGKLAKVVWWDDNGRHHETWSVGHEGELSFVFDMDVEDGFDRREGYIPIEVSHPDIETQYLSIPYVIQPVTNTVSIPDMTTSLYEANQWISPHGTIVVSGNVVIEEDETLVLKQGVTIEGDTSSGHLPRLVMSAEHPFYIRELHNGSPVHLKNLYLDMTSDTYRFRIVVQYAGLVMENVAMDYNHEGVQSMRLSYLKMNNVIFRDGGLRDDMWDVSISRTEVDIEDATALGFSPRLQGGRWGNEGSMGESEIVFPNGQVFQIGSDASQSDPMPLEFDGSVVEVDNVDPEPTFVSTIYLRTLMNTSLDFVVSIFVLMLFATAFLARKQGGVN